MPKKVLCFDMDGTIVNLYAVHNWLPMLEASDPTPYAKAEPMFDMPALRNLLLELESKGWEIRVISWLAKNSTPDYDWQVRITKKAWLAMHGFPASTVHIVKYGTTKADCVRAYADVAVLVDDNAEVRKGWHIGPTINPTEGNLFDELRKVCI